MIEDLQKIPMLVDDIHKASRQAKYKPSPDGVKARGITTENGPVSSTGFPEYLQVPSLPQFLALPEDFPYRADLRIPDGVHNIDTVEWMETFHEFEKLCEELKKDTTESEWNKAAFSWELARNISNTSLGISQLSCDQGFIILTLLIEMSVKLGLEKRVAEELVKIFEQKGVAWQQGLPRPGQAASRVESERGGDSSPAR